MHNTAITASTPARPQLDASIDHWLASTSSHRYTQVLIILSCVTLVSASASHRTVVRVTTEQGTLFYPGFDAHIHQSLNRSFSGTGTCRCFYFGNNNNSNSNTLLLQRVPSPLTLNHSIIFFHRYVRACVGVVARWKGNVASWACPLAPVPKSHLSPSSTCRPLTCSPFTWPSRTLFFTPCLLHLI